MLDAYWSSPSKAKQRLTSTDPTLGLVEYFQEVKPYHTKLLEVAVRHTFEERALIKCGESLHIQVELENRYWDPVIYQCNNGYDLDYGHGYGIVWMGGYGGDTNDLPPVPRPPLISDVEFDSDDDGFADNGYDGKINPIVTGDIPHVTTIDASIVQAVSDDNPDLPANTFLIEYPEPEIYAMMLTNFESTTFGFVKPYDIIGVIPLKRVWRLKGNVTADFKPGGSFYVDTTNRLEYTIATATLDEDGNTEVLTNESIALSAKSTGTAGIMIPKRAYPWWPTDMRVRVVDGSNYDKLEGPLFFRPIIDSIDGAHFNLAFSQIGENVVLNEVPNVRLMIHNLDVFLPGMNLVVTSGGANDGLYTVYRAEPEDGKLRIWTLQHVTETKIDNAGTMNYDIGDGFIKSEYCRTIDSDPLHVRVIVHEELSIEVEEILPPTGQLVLRTKLPTGRTNDTIRIQTTNSSTGRIRTYNNDSVLLRTITLDATGTDVDITSGDAFVVVDNIGGSGSYVIRASGAAVNQILSWEDTHPRWIGLAMWNDAVGCPNLTSVPKHLPRTFTTLSGMFKRATIFNSANLIDWDTTNITEMAEVFQYATEFNQPLNSWNVSNVTNMSRMFESAVNFDRPLDRWNLSKLIDCTYMFRSASKFNRPIGMWNLTAAKQAYNMFEDATAFDQDISTWKLTGVLDFGSMFRNASTFNQDISNWDMSRATSTANMFRNATRFDRSIGKWNVSNVTNMSGMFAGAAQFNRDLSNWDVSKVTNMNNMFEKAVRFNGNIDSWDTKNLRTMEYMFYGATQFNRDIGGWDVSKVTTMLSTFGDAVNFNQDLSQWNTISLTSLNATFSGAIRFNGNITNWNTSKVTNMYTTFKDTQQFNQDIGNWDTSKVTNMNFMFSQAIAFNQDVGRWNTSSVTSMIGMFHYATSFNQNLRRWCVSNILEFPDNFDFNATAWTLPRPIWGTCP